VASKSAITSSVAGWLAIVRCHLGVGGGGPVGVVGTTETTIEWSVGVAGRVIMRWEVAHAMPPVKLAGRHWRRISRKVSR